jgi:RHS repeat-associated protein
MGMVALLLGVLVGVAQAIPPSVSLLSAGLVDPSNAWTNYYSTSTTHTNGVVAWASRPPEIKALARALSRGGQLTTDQFASRVFDYVRLNIEPEFRFGLGKGARGAAVDQSGTPFDQAQLMVEILREGGVTANYQLGTIRLSAAQFGAWTGLVYNLNQGAQTFTVGAKAACTLLADGGIPAVINGTPATCESLSMSTTLSTVDIMHLWVQVNGKLYDPSYKPHALKTGIDLPAAMGCGTASAPTCGSTTHTAAMTGATQDTLSGGVPYIQNANYTSLTTQLGIYATALGTTIKSVDHYAQTEDIVSGGRIDTNYSPPIGASLPYTTPSTFVTWTGDIPDKYRTTLTVQFLGLNQVFYADELYGKDLRVATLGPRDSWTRSSVIYVDGVQIGSTATYAAGVNTQDIVTLGVNHPYTADAAGSSTLTGTYADETQALYAGEDHRNSDREYVYSGGGSTIKFNADWPNLITITWSLGETGPGFQTLVANRPSPAVPPLLSVWQMIRAQHPTNAAQYLVQSNAATRLLAGASKANISTHHALGVVFASYLLDTVSGQINITSGASVASRSSSETERQAAFATYALINSAVEGSVMQQAEEGWESFSAVSLLKRANDTGQQFLQVDSGNWTAAQSLLSSGGYDSARLANVQWFTSNGFQLVIPKNASPAPVPLSGGTMYMGPSAEIASKSGQVAYTVGERLKGSAAAAGLDPAASAAESVKLVDYALKARKSYALDAVSGAVTLTPPADLVTGTGAFPRALEFRRRYSSSEAARNSCHWWFGDWYAAGVTCAPSRDGSFIANVAGGWRHSLEISAEWVNNGLEALGETSALRASRSIATIYAALDLARSPTSAKRLTASFAAYALASSYMKNAFVVHVPGGAQVFVKLPDGSYDSPINAPSAQITSNESRSVPFMLGSQNVLFDYSGTSLQYRSPAGDFANFSWGSAALIVAGATYLEVTNPAFTITDWTSADGAKATFTYTDVDSAQTYAGSGRRDRVLSQVTNNLGRSLTFTSTHTLDLHRITSVTDESSRTVNFSAPNSPDCLYAGTNWSSETSVLPDCLTTLTVNGADGQATIYSYVADSDSPNPAVTVSPAVPLRKWFTPTSSTQPFLTLLYDEQWNVKGAKDALGNVTSLYTASVSTEFDKLGETVDATGAAARTYADRFGNHLIEIDPLGRITTHSYDNTRRRIRTVYPEQNYDDFYYDIRSNLTETRRYPKLGSSLTYTSEQTSYVEGPTVLTCVTLAKCNKPASTTDARGNVTTYAYLSNGQLQRITGPAITTPGSPGVNGNAQTDYCYGPFTGTSGTISLPVASILKVSGTESRVTSFAYNATTPATNHLVLLSATKDPATTYVPPGTAGNACTTASKSGALALSTGFTFDSVGNVNTINGPVSGTGDTTTYTFDKMRRLTKIAAPLGAATRYCFDADGLLVGTQRARVSGATDPNAATAITTGQCAAAFNAAQWQGETRSYYPTGDLLTSTDAEGNQSTYAYDAVGRQRVVQDPDGRQTATVYDAAGQTVATWRGGTTWITGTGTGTVPNATDPVTANRVPDINLAWVPTSYTGSGRFRYAFYSYTLNGKQDYLLDANNNKTDYAYDGLDRLQFALFPNASDGALCTAPATDSGTPTCAASNGTTPTYEMYGYDYTGNRTSLRTRKADTIGYHYDQANRQDTKTPAAQGAVTTYLNLAGEPIQIAEAAYGSNAAHTTAYLYDAVGRKTSETNDTRAVTYQYDNTGNRTRTTWPDSYYVSYAYDLLNRMQVVRENSTTTNELAYYTYDTLSRRLSVCMGAWTSTTCQAGGGTNKATYSYETDSDLDLLTQILNAATVTLDYGHNRSHQITSIAANDDFYLVKPATAASRAYVPNALNQYNSVAGNAATYDFNGNLLTWYPLDGSGKQTYTYDSENRLATAAVNGSGTATISYDYDGLGRRYGKTVSGTTTSYLLDGDEEIAEYSGSTLLRRYITGPAIDDRIAHIEYVSGTAYRSYYHVNHQGSVVAVTDANGNTAGCATNVVCQRMAYDEYGNLTSGASSSGEQFRYTGRRFDPETGLYYYRARYYAPGIGRFLQTDPIAYEDDYNVYSYVANDPPDSTDPTGMVILLAIHSVAGGFNHSKIVIIPANQAKYANNKYFSKILPNGKRFATIGAGEVNGKLVAGLNRDTDVEKMQSAMNIQEQVLRNLNGMSEDEAIDALLNASQEYDNQADYMLFPGTPGRTGGYNSNSFIAGLLNRLGISGYGRPFIAPGFMTPLPPKYFTVTVSDP